MKIAAGADDGAADGDALQDHVEDRRREFTGGQPDQTDGAPPANHLQRLRKSSGGHRCHQNAVCPAARCGQDLLHGIRSQRVDGEIGAKVTRQRELVLGDIDRDDLQSHGFCVLDRDMAEPAGARDDDPFAGPRFKLLQSLVGGDARAQDRGDRRIIDVLGQLCCERSRGDDVFGETAVHAVAGVVLMLAQRFPSGLAVFAGKAGIMQPRYADRIADFQVGHSRSECRDNAGSLMAGNEGWNWLYRPIAGCRMQIGVADAARFHFDQNFARTRLWHRNILNRKGLAELCDDGGFHGWHRLLPSFRKQISDYAPVVP